MNPQEHLGPGTLPAPAAPAVPLLALIGLSLLLLVLACADLWSEPALLWPVRLPRVLGAWAAGASLGLAGALAQSLFRNPLADPYLVGSASGANLGVSLSLILLGTIRIELAFAGALAAVTLAVLLARGRDGLLLAGFVISIVLSALVALLLVWHPEHLRSSQLFMLGQTHLLDWSASGQMLGLLLAALVPILWLAPSLQALSLGDQAARSMGVPVPRLRLFWIAMIALLSASSVAACGMLAFVGLGAPHLARSLFGARLLDRMRLHLLASLLTGGLLLSASDLLARSLSHPAEWPVGIVTALLGGLYLLGLLARR